MKSGVPGNTKSCIGRSTVLKTKTVPILLHLAKQERHAGAEESPSTAGLVSTLQTIDALRHSGTKSEHGQTMIRVLKTIFAPRLRELAVDPVRAQ